MRRTATKKGVEPRHPALEALARAPIDPDEETEAERAAAEQAERGPVLSGKAVSKLIAGQWPGRRSK